MKRSFLLLAMIFILVLFAGCSVEGDITKAEYSQIKTGQTYSEVVQIIGSKGELTSSSSMEILGDDYTASIYTWYGNLRTGANSVIMFENNEVTAKSQFGLK